jgi:hypothetical protein
MRQPHSLAKEEACALAAEWGWPPVTTRGGGDRSYEVIWAVNDNVTFHYVEDHSSGEACCLFGGSARDDLEHAFRRAEKRLDAWSLDELLDGAYPMDKSPAEMAAALFRLGLGAPSAFTQTVFDYLSLAFDYPHPMVRAAAVRSTAYFEWPELRMHLDNFADDPDERVRAEAELVKTAFDRVFGGNRDA